MVATLAEGIVAWWGTIHGCYLGSLLEQLKNKSLTTDEDSGLCGFNQLKVLF